MVDNRADITLIPRALAVAPGHDLDAAGAAIAVDIDGETEVRGIWSRIEVLDRWKRRVAVHLDRWKRRVAIHLGRVHVDVALAGGHVISIPGRDHLFAARRILFDRPRQRFALLPPEQAAA